MAKSQPKPKAASPAKQTPKRMVAHRPQPRSDDAHAFIPDPSEGGKPPEEDLAEILGEDYVQAATQGNDALEDDLDATLPDEIGGPFVITEAREELANDVDESNPLDAEPAAFPTSSAGLVGSAAAPADEEEEEDEP